MNSFFLLFNFQPSKMWHNLFAGINGTSCYITSVKLDSSHDFAKKNLSMKKADCIYS